MHTCRAFYKEAHLPSIPRNRTARTYKVRMIRMQNFVVQKYPFPFMRDWLKWDLPPIHLWLKGYKDGCNFMVVWNIESNLFNCCRLFEVIIFSLCHFNYNVITRILYNYCFTVVFVEHRPQQSGLELSICLIFIQLNPRNSTEDVLKKSFTCE